MDIKALLLLLRIKNSPTDGKKKGQKFPSSPIARWLDLLFKIFVGIFGVGLVILCLYWVVGNGKRNQQTVANMLIYLWGFMLFGLFVGVVKWLTE